MLYILAFENPKNYEVGQMSCVWNYQKEVIKTSTPVPCRSGWRMEQNLRFWQAQVSVCFLKEGFDILPFISGSLYLLILIAFGKLKSSICSLTGDMVPQLASLIRHPTADTAFGRQVINSIIPALTHLRDTFTLSFSTMFSYQLLQDYDLSADFDAADLEKSDIFFNSLPIK